MGACDGDPEPTMTAVHGYECDRCKVVMAIGWRTLRFHYGWTMLARTSPTDLNTLHFCGPCSENRRLTQ